MTVCQTSSECQGCRISTSKNHLVLAGKTNMQQIILSFGMSVKSFGMSVKTGSVRKYKSKKEKNWLQGRCACTVQEPRVSGSDETFFYTSVLIISRFTISKLLGRTLNEENAVFIPNKPDLILRKCYSYLCTLVRYPQLLSSIIE